MTSYDRYILDMVNEDADFLMHYGVPGQRKGYHDPRRRWQPQALYADGKENPFATPKPTPTPKSTRGGSASYYVDSNGRGYASTSARSSSRKPVGTRVNSSNNDVWAAFQGSTGNKHSIPLDNQPSRITRDTGNTREARDTRNARKPVGQRLDGFDQDGWEGYERASDIGNNIGGNLMRNLPSSNPSPRPTPQRPVPHPTPTPPANEQDDDMFEEVPNQNTEDQARANARRNMAERQSNTDAPFSNRVAPREKSTGNVESRKVNKDYSNLFSSYVDELERRRS